MIAPALVILWLAHAIQGVPGSSLAGRLLRACKHALVVWHPHATDNGGLRLVVTRVREH